MAADIVKHPVRNLALSALLGGGLFLGWYLTRPEPVEVVVREAGLGTVEATVANTRAGTVMACRRARLSPADGGQIAKLPVHEGERVKAGQLILALWSEDLRANVALAGAEVVTARAKGRATCLEAEQAEREAQRMLKLRRTDVASEDETDQAVTKARARRANCMADKAAVEVSGAKLALARAKLERTLLQAPFDGVIADINGELNEYVTPSPPGIPTLPVVDLIDDSRFYVKAPIDEVDAPALRPGMCARITLDAFPGRDFPGRVRRVADYVLDLEKQARTVDVEVAFARPEDTLDLLAGYSADVEVIVDRRRDTLRVPSEALIEDRELLVFRPDTGRLEARSVTTGLANWDYTEILSGLKAGEQVVVSLDREGVLAGAAAVLEQASE
jgi:HlyD family secretion protein